MHPEGVAHELGLEVVHEHGLDDEEQGRDDDQPFRFEDGGRQDWRHQGQRRAEDGTGTSMASAEATTIRKPYGRPTRSTTAIVSAAWIPARTTCARQESAKRRRDRAFEDLRLLRVSVRDDPIHPCDDRRAVGEHVEAEDDHEHERPEDRNGDGGRFPSADCASRSAVASTSR